MSARKTWSGNTIDERSIAFSSSARVNIHTQSPVSLVLFFFLSSLCSSLPVRLSWSPFTFIFVRDSYLPGSRATSTCILLYKEFKLSINFHQLASRWERVRVPVPTHGKYEREKMELDRFNQPSFVPDIPMIIKQSRKHLCFTSPFHLNYRGIFVFLRASPVIEQSTKSEWNE